MPDANLIIYLMKLLTHRKAMRSEARHSRRVHIYRTCKYANVYIYAKYACIASPAWICSYCAYDQEACTVRTNSSRRTTRERLHVWRRSITCMYSQPQHELFLFLLCIWPGSMHSKNKFKQKDNSRPHKMYADRSYIPYFCFVPA